MGFLHKLWDETLAGPAPENGLGRLRKYSSVSAAETPPSPPPSLYRDHINVTHSITMLRSNSTPRNRCLDPDSVPGSPRGSSTPESPLSRRTPSWDYKRVARRKSPADEAFDRVDSRSLTDYDWIVILSAIDR